MTTPSKTNTTRSASGRHLPAGTTRRDILRYGAAGMGLAALGPLAGKIRMARGAPAGQKFLVVIYLFGGNDGTNMLPPITLDNYYTLRDGLAIPAGSERSLNSGPAATTSYGLHPAMPNLQGMYHDGDLAPVNLVGYPSANLSHFTSQDIYSFGVRGEFAALGIPESGWIARYADANAPTPLGAVSVGVGRPLDLVGGTSNPFLVSSLSAFKFNPDYGYMDNHLHRLDAIRDILDGFSRTGLSQDAADALSQGHDLADQIQAAVEAYASTAVYEASDGRTHNIHRQLQDIARLVQYGFETRVFYTGFGGFDTHSDQGMGEGRQATLFDRLDTALGAFRQDMMDMGVWNQTTFVVASEFGRRNFVNGSGGTDHGHGNVFLVGGGAVNGGVYGRDVTTADLEEDWLGYDVDFRDIYRELLDDHLGANTSTVFPETQPSSSTLGLV